ncbi:MAG: hypothetical protein HY536_00885 [Candidatus Colwellbacteria bacterium]|nr:hypothetical protein [Candidatus Colwellbacteria bacterium]
MQTIEPTHPNATFLTEELPAKVPYRLFSVAFVVFLSLIALYGGLRFGYRPFLEREIESDVNQIRDIEGRLIESERRNFQEFYSQLVNIKRILKNHRAASRLFPILEGVTRTDVAFTSLAVSTDERTLVAEGVAASHASLASQLLAFERARDTIEKVGIDSARLTDGGVSFQVKLTIRDEVFR